LANTYCAAQKKETSTVREMLAHRIAEVLFGAFLFASLHKTKLVNGFAGFAETPIVKFYLTEYFGILSNSISRPNSTGQVVKTRFPKSLRLRKSSLDKCTTYPIPKVRNSCLCEAKQQKSPSANAPGLRDSAVPTMGRENPGPPPIQYRYALQTTPYQQKSPSANAPGLRDSAVPTMGRENPGPPRFNIGMPYKLHPSNKKAPVQMHRGFVIRLSRPWVGRTQDHPDSISVYPTNYTLATKKPQCKCTGAS
jgi:hypothetical protein